MARSEPIRVYRRGQKAWWLLAFILICLSLLMALTHEEGKGPNVGAAVVFAALAAALIVYLIVRSIRYIEFGDAIVIAYQLHQRAIEWREVKDIDFDRTDASVPTHIPLVSIPLVEHSLTLHLVDGSKVTLAIKPAVVPAIAQVIDQQATLDVRSRLARKPKPE